MISILRVYTNHLYNISGSFCCTQANKKYPHQLILPPHYECVLEEDGGILLASKCVAAFQVGQVKFNKASNRAWTVLFVLARISLSKEEVC